MTKTVKPNRKYLGVRVKPNLITLLNSRSAEQGITRSQLVERVVESYLSTEFSENLQQKSA